MSLLMNVYEKNERQWKESLAQQTQSANRDQDLENTGGSGTSREWCDDPNFAAYSPHAHQPRNAKGDQDLNINCSSVASREWCDDGDLEALKEPCRETPEACREWCDDADLEAPERWYPQKDADRDMIMKSEMIEEEESVTSQAAVVTPMNHRPGAYAVMQGRGMQHRQHDGGTTTAAVNPTTVVPAEPTPITAEVVEDNQLDISSHIRRILAENAIPAKSVVLLDEGNELADRNSDRDSEVLSVHWRKLILIFLCLILLAVVATVVAVVVLLTKDPEPTTTITIVIQLDDHPEETGWELQHNKALVAYPPGTYRDKNSLVKAQIDVYTGKEYKFTLFDAGSNGIDGGYYEIYDAPDTSDLNTVLFKGSGDFTDQVQHDFTPVGQEAK
jgi:hypothetical protein